MNIFERMQELAGVNESSGPWFLSVRVSDKLRDQSFTPDETVESALKRNKYKFYGSEHLDGARHFFFEISDRNDIEKVKSELEDEYGSEDYDKFIYVEYNVQTQDDLDSIKGARR